MASTLINKDINMKLFYTLLLSSLLALTSFGQSRTNSVFNGIVLKGAAGQAGKVLTVLDADGTIGFSAAASGSSSMYVTNVYKVTRVDTTYYATTNDTVIWAETGGYNVYMPTNTPEKGYTLTIKAAYSGTGQNVAIMGGDYNIGDSSEPYITINDNQVITLQFDDGTGIEAVPSWKTIASYRYPTPTPSGGIDNPMTTDLDAGSFNITNVLDISGDGTATGAVKVNGVKVYRALLTQTTLQGDETSYDGGSGLGALIVGRTYVIATLNAPDDFSNVGYVSDGTPFVATGTTPSVWTTATIVKDLTASAPVATVLENTMGGTVVWSYVEAGHYTANATGVFTANKTLIFISINGFAGTFPNPVKSRRVDSDQIDISTFSNDTLEDADGVLIGNSIEILVYP